MCFERGGNRSHGVLMPQGALDAIMYAWSRSYLPQIRIRIRFYVVRVYENSNDSFDIEEQACKYRQKDHLAHLPSTFNGYSRQQSLETPYSRTYALFPKQCQTYRTTDMPLAATLAAQR